MVSSGQVFCFCVIFEMTADFIWKSVFWTVSIIFATYILTVSYYEGVDETELEFNKFIRKYNKTYDHATDEYYKRLTIFRRTVERIHELNSNRTIPESAMYGITQFADLTPLEFRMTILKPITAQISKWSNPVSGNHIHHVHKRETPPSKFDWRDKSVITSVKNQGQCGACWAFSTVEMVESMNAIQTGKLEELSVQQVTDCAGDGNYGCSGGNTCLVLQWLSTSKIRVLTEKQYPQTASNQPCKIKKPKTGILIAANYTCENLNGEESHMMALLQTHGPLVATVDAQTWQYYLGGIIQYHCESVGNHAVQIIGYDSTGSVPYYIVRNSWGTDFGIKGYLYIAIGSNLCGISNEVSTLNILS